MFMTKNPIKRLSERPQKNGQEVGGWYSAVKELMEKWGQRQQKPGFTQSIRDRLSWENRITNFVGKLVCCLLIQQKETLIPQFT